VQMQLCVGGLGENIDGVMPKIKTERVTWRAKPNTTVRSRQKAEI